MSLISASRSLPADEMVCANLHLLVGEVAGLVVGEQLRQDQRGVERRAQLVAHVGEELGLVLVRRARARRPARSASPARAAARRAGSRAAAPAPRAASWSARARPAATRGAPAIPSATWLCSSSSSLATRSSSCWVCSSSDWRWVSSSSSSSRVRSLRNARRRPIESRNAAEQILVAGPTYGERVRRSAPIHTVDAAGATSSSFCGVPRPRLDATARHPVAHPSSWSGRFAGRPDPAVRRQAAARRRASPAPARRPRHATEGSVGLGDEAPRRTARPDIRRGTEHALASASRRCSPWIRLVRPACPARTHASVSRAL